MAFISQAARDENGAHFDVLLADILKELESSYTSAFEEDLQKTDAVGYTVVQRLNMYTSSTTPIRISVIRICRSR